MDLGKITTEIEDQRIVVTMEGSAYRATYHLDRQVGKLLQSEAMESDNGCAVDRRQLFERLAWEAANAKARELGWI